MCVIVLVDRLDKNFHFIHCSTALVKRTMNIVFSIINCYILDVRSVLKVSKVQKAVQIEG